MAVIIFLIVSLIALMLCVVAYATCRIEKEMKRATKAKEAQIQKLKKPQCYNTTAHHDNKNNDYDYRSTKEGNKTMPSKLCE